MKVDGSICIELPQKSTLQRSDEHWLKGSLGTNLLWKEKKESSCESARNKILRIALDYVIFALARYSSSVFSRSACLLQATRRLKRRTRTRTITSSSSSLLKSSRKHSRNMTDAISIEETNRLRVSLGMKPLPVPGAAPSGPVFKESSEAPAEEAGSTLESRQAEGYDNYRKLQEAELAKKKREAKAESIKKARDAAKRFAKLEGKGLGDAEDEEDLDARSWLIKQKKRQKEIEKARKRERELAEAEAAAEYTAADLAGVKVAHELGNFEEGEEQVLTLKDTTIDENEEDGDELENLDLRERERLTEKLELKKKKPVYNPNDIDETGEKSILAHYDEEIEGKKVKKFTLDGKGNIAEENTANGSVSRASKPKAISLDILSTYS